MAETLINQLTDSSKIPPRLVMPERLGTRDDVEYWEIYRRNQFIKKVRIIGEFIRQGEYGIEILEVKDKLVLSISEESGQRIDPVLLERIVDQFVITEESRLSSRCFDVAKKACLEQGFTGRIAAMSGCGRFTDSDNHCINWHKLDDGSVVGIDLTTSLNISMRTNEFHILLLHSESMNSLKSMLNRLYGGLWRPIEVDTREPVKQIV